MEHTLRLRKGAWTSDEDDHLRTCIATYGEGQWHRVPLRAGLNRCRKSCRLRWLNYLKPNIKRGSFAVDEIDLIIRMHKLLGNRWSLIAGRLPGRTANDVKNYWNTHLKKHYYQSSKKEIAAPQTTRTKLFKPRPWTFSNKFFFGPCPQTRVPDTPTTSSPAASDKLSESSSLWWQNLIAYNGDVENEQGRNNCESIGEEMVLPNEASNSVNELNSYAEDKGLWSDFCLDNVDFWDLLDAPHGHDDQLSFST